MSIQQPLLAQDRDLTRHGIFVIKPTSHPFPLFSTFIILNGSHAEKQVEVALDNLVATRRFRKQMAGH